MANLTKYLTSISLERRSGPSPGRRLLAAVLCTMLAFGSVFPGLALAGEAASEGEGTAPTVEVPIPPDFDPGGEEGTLEEVSAVGGEEESGALEAEPEADLEMPASGEVTSAAPAPLEAPPPPIAVVPQPATSAPEPIQQRAPEPATSEPVANQSIVAPQQKPAEQRADSSGASADEVAPSEAPVEEAPSAPPPQLAASPPADHTRHLGGRHSYVVRSGDCLWHIAAALLSARASDAEIAGEVARLWALNEDTIGTGDPNLIYAGTTLRLR
jgi:LysM domain-containing protein